MMMIIKKNDDYQLLWKITAFTIHIKEIQYLMLINKG